MRDLSEPIDQLADRVASRPGWWAEPSGNDDDQFVVCCQTGVIAENLTRHQAMTIASEYNLARTDAQALAKHRQGRGSGRGRGKKSA